MTERAASKTALLVAAYRGRASASDDALCCDPWAATLAGSEGLELTRAYDSTFPHMELWVALRTASLDAIKSRAVASGVRQIVILGAGLDTRGARLGAQGVRFFEVDQASSQRDKRARLAVIEAYPRDAATYVECDFEHDDFIERLASA